MAIIAKIGYFAKKKRKTMFLRGFEADEPRISGFFKLQKIRTGKNIVFSFFIVFPKIEKQPRW
jgi:hypothetical protein